MKKLLTFIFTAVMLLSCSGPKDGNYTFQLLTTNDVHGSWFDSTYVGGDLKKSLYAAKFYIDSARTAIGEENTLLVDAGDCLQGDNVAYYFNYVETETPHIYPRLAAYMGYDVVTVGNHDIETGHPVYDRIRKDLESYGIPFLGGNAIKTDNGKPYFQTYKMFKKAGVKVAVLGYTNANIKAWLTESLWSGMTFESLLPLVQNDVDAVIAKEKPEIVIVSVHSGTGEGDGSILESQGLDLYKSLKNVDFLVCAHDHRAVTFQSDSIVLLNAGSRAGYVAQGLLNFTVKDGKVVNKELSAKLIPVDQSKTDQKMRVDFHEDFEKVKAFTLQEVGKLDMDLYTRESFQGQCDYINFIHTVQIGCTPAQLSFAAPLTYNGTIKAGTLIYNDLFTLYPYENQLFVVELSGKEIKDYLEYSYDNWIQTASKPTDHVFKIRPRGDSRYDQAGWSFTGATFNFDSMAGLNYTVDVTKPYGERLNITTLVDGSAFSLDAKYKVAMTSYRASGGGDLLPKGAGVDTDNIDERVVERYPEIREIIYDYLKKNGSISHDKVSDPSVIGTWSFVPEKIAGPAVENDMKLLFGQK
ncbi:MAG: 5'-nucleotidase C-terminal domain-containing protein [Bacteroidales bacterium]|nr:5'-nucleotidase C-terminal domain-containing protein [Bacteroidales bacterium]